MIPQLARGRGSTKWSRPDVGKARRRNSGWMQTLQLEFGADADGRVKKVVIYIG